jgi:hypothetical protein
LAPISWIGFFLAARAISMSDFTSAMFPSGMVFDPAALDRDGSRSDGRSGTERPYSPPKA